VGVHERNGGNPTAETGPRATPGTSQLKSAAILRFANGGERDGPGMSSSHTPMHGGSDLGRSRRPDERKVGGLGGILVFMGEQPFSSLLCVLV
jgi:hypothetical protein